MSVCIVMISYTVAYNFGLAMILYRQQSNVGKIITTFM